MTITEITTDKKRYLDLLLLADEEERMIDCYLERGRLFVLEDPEVKTVCVVTDEGDGVAEIKIWRRRRLRSDGDMGARWWIM